MDDVPAGPASPMLRRPSLSVVVPVRNGGRDFGRCLQRLRGSSLADFELIVVDDGSTDDSAVTAARAGADLAPTAHAARTRGGAQPGRSGRQSSQLVFFLDADVAVHRETLARALARFERDPSLCALFGSYDDQPTATGIVSQYRNLLHHFVHQQGVFVDEIRPAHTFWTGCGAIRRERLSRIWRFRPPALSPARNRRHRAGLPAHPHRPPDRARSRRSGHAHEAVDPRAR